MASNTRNLDRVLDRLERNYDKDHAYVRKYYGAIADIRDLLNARKIDRDHADFLAAQAKEEFRRGQREHAELKRKRHEDRFVESNSGIVFFALLLMVIGIIYYVATM